jgi:hypothetical protein
MEIGYSWCCADVTRDREHAFWLVPFQSSVSKNTPRDFLEEVRMGFIPGDSLTSRKNVLLTEHHGFKWGQQPTDHAKTVLAGEVNLHLEITHQNSLSEERVI